MIAGKGRRAWRSHLPLLIVAVLAGGLVGGCSARTTMDDRLPDDPPAVFDRGQADDTADQEDVELGPTDEAESALFTFSLVLPGEQEMREFLAGLHDPSSAHYRKFLNAAAFGARFGLPEADVDAIVSWLADNRFELVMRTPQRTSLTARGRVGDINRAFGVRLVDWQTAAGVRYHRPDVDPTVPPGLAGRVTSVVGLDTEPAIKPAAFVDSDAAGVPNGGMRPEDVRRAYEIEELHAAGLHGEGQTVAILSFDTFDPADVAAWDAEMGITGPPVEVVRILGASDIPGSGVGEVNLDIDVIRGIAPAAQIINYEAPNLLSNFGPLVARIVGDGRADIISLSWGKCEKYVPPQILAANEQEFQAMFAAGISLFVASGDDGAYGCRRVRVSDDLFDRDLSPDVDSPSSSPSTISVGGTFLTVRQDGTYFEEAGWEEPLGGTGAGGGVSQVYDRPSWQQGVGVDNAHSTGKRQVPDVGGPSDGDSGFIVIYSEGGERVMGAVGGTSAAAPFWAGSMALARQLGGQSGLTGLGALGPTLYQLAAERPDVFHDVIKGGNLLHQATVGWDYVTGIGTPRVGPLAQALVELLSR